MRILAIRGKNLASLKGDFAVELNKAPLEQAGLFAISGQTGSGKSTLLDAMCLALYDKIPRLLNTVHVKIGRSDEDEKQRISSNDVVSIMTRGTASAYAEVDFIGVDKQIYQARWDLKRARNKVSGRLQKQTIKLKDIIRNETIGQNKSDTLEEISQRIGLTFEQFRRSVLLAQGDFAAFLKARSDERSALLERITGTDIYSQLSMAAYRQFQHEDQLLTRIQDKMELDIPLQADERNELQIKKIELEDVLSDSQIELKNCQTILQWHEQNEYLHKEYDITKKTLSDLQEKQAQLQPLKTELEKIISVQKLRPTVLYLDELNKKQKQFITQLNEANNKCNLEINNEQQLTDNVTKLQEQLNAATQQHEKVKPFLVQARVIAAKTELMVNERASRERKSHELEASLSVLQQKKVNIQEYHEKKKTIELSLSQVSKQILDLQQQRQSISLEKLNTNQDICATKDKDFQQLKEMNKLYRGKQADINLWQEKKSHNEIDIKELLKGFAAHQEEYQQSLAVCDEARRALTIIQESVTKGAESLRSLLQDKQACPVCGSIEHPWAKQGSMLNEHYQQQKDRVNELEQKLQKSQRELNQTQQKINYLKLEQTNQEKHIRQADTELQELVNHWQTLSAQYSFLKAIDCAASEEQLDIEINSNNRDSEEIKEQLKLAVSLQKKLDEHQRSKDQLHNEEKKTVTIISQQNELLTNINHMTTMIDTVQKELNEVNQELNELDRERQTLFSEHFSSLMQDKKITDVDVLESTLLDYINKLTEQYENLKKNLQQSSREKIRITEHCHYLQQQVDDTVRQAELQEKKLTTELQQLSLELPQLKQLLLKNELWIKQQQDEMSQLNNECIKMATLLSERQSKLDNHQLLFQSFSQAMSALSISELSEQLEHYSERIKILQSTQQEIQFALKTDDEKRQRISNYQLEFNEQQQRWNSWSVLNDLIGSASGNKFRVFAQSLTLESLLIHANEHLNDFARRYQLQRVPASDMDVQIIDRDMADEVRSVQSLSGGESFLVSLALALGLASLSSTKTQVESLFIDEGFGTLDQETLDVAISSLDTLQGLGRKVGIISHVPILVERIGTRVVVEKLGGGQSRVLVAS